MNDSSSPPETDVPSRSNRLSAFQLLAVFLRLGLTSFGGPVAHLGYFRDEFVARHNCLSEHDHADLVALCQFLPGPASSQVGMGIGISQAGIRGALAAWRVSLFRQRQPSSCSRMELPHFKGP